MNPLVTITKFPLSFKQILAGLENKSTSVISANIRKLNKSLISSKDKFNHSIKILAFERGNFFKKMSSILILNQNGDTITNKILNIFSNVLNSIINQGMKTNHVSFGLKVNDIYDLILPSLFRALQSFEPNWTICEKILEMIRTKILTTDYDGNNNETMQIYLMERCGLNILLSLLMQIPETQPNLLQSTLDLILILLKKNLNNKNINKNKNKNKNNSPQNYQDKQNHQQQQQQQERPSSSNPINLDAFDIPKVLQKFSILLKLNDPIISGRICRILTLMIEISIENKNVYYFQQVRAKILRELSFCLLVPIINIIHEYHYLNVSALIGELKPLLVELLVNKNFHVHLAAQEILDQLQESEKF